jgi:hypothetical protein
VCVCVCVCVCGEVLQNMEGEVPTESTKLPTRIVEKLPYMQ